MSNHPGLRLSLAGFVVFGLGILSLLVLPDIVAMVLMLAGGMGVWIGFFWTILSSYSSSSQPPDA